MKSGGNQPTSRLNHALVVLLLALVPVLASAQIGRTFVSAEAYVGMARIVHVGKIVELAPIEHGKPLTERDTTGSKPWRLVLDVSETIRGDEVKRLELVFSPGVTDYLGYMRDHSAEILLMGGPAVGSRLYPYVVRGIKEQGRQSTGEWYQFRLMDPVIVPESGKQTSMEKTLNSYFDSGRMFTHEFAIVTGREAILGRMRAFARKHTEVLATVTLPVPHEFGKLCGDPNAGPFISLPLCPETKATLFALKNDPGLIVRRINAWNADFALSQLRSATDKALAEFPEKGQRDE